MIYLTLVANNELAEEYLCGRKSGDFHSRRAKPEQSFVGRYPTQALEIVQEEFHAAQRITLVTAVAWFHEGNVTNQVVA